MKLIVRMPWEKDLSVNTMRFGAGGGYRKKPHVQEWIWLMKKEFWLRWALNEFEFKQLALPIYVQVDFRFPDKRRRDDHNYYKVICDAVAAGLDIDDKDIRISTGTVTVDRERPGFTITVEDRK